MKKLTDEQERFLIKSSNGNWLLDRETGLVNVGGSFHCYQQDLKNFKGIEFGIIKGSFDCSYNNLTNLIGAPQVVEGYFSCKFNQLLNFVGSPEKIGGGFYGDRKTSLKGLKPLGIELAIRLYDYNNKEQELYFRMDRINSKRYLNTLIKQLYR